MFNSIVSIIPVIASAVVIITVIVAAAKGGFGIFGKIAKIDSIDKGVNALLLLHHGEIIAQYRDQIKLVFNPIPSPDTDRDELLQKLEDGSLNSVEARRFTEILKSEEAEAKHKDNQMAVLAIGGLLLLLALLSKE